MVALCCATWLLPGCAILHGEDPPSQDAAEPAKQAETTEAGQVGPVGSEPAVTAFDIRVEVQDEDLRELIERHNELQRYRAVTDLDASEFARIMVLGERDVRNLLGTEGYFSPEVKLTREGAPGDKPTVVIRVEPGQATTIAKVDIGFEGDIASSTDAGAVAQRDGIRDNWSLPEGRRFTQDRWSGAKTNALRELVERRYPRGKISHSIADVDAPADTAALGLTLDSGPPFTLGAARVVGAKRYPDWLPERLSWLKPGDVYDQKKLVDAQQRLAGSGYYDSAYISIDPDASPDDTPVSYAVTEAKRHKVQLGVGYSTDGGPRVTLEHRDNQTFGSSWRSDTKLNYDTKQPLLQTEFTSLPAASGWRKAVFGRYMRQDDGSLITTSQTVKLGIVKTTERYDRNLDVRYDNASVTGAASVNAPAALVGDGAAISVNYSWTGRYFNQLPVPTSGYGLQGEVGLGMTTVGDRKPFVRLNGRWMGILPIQDGKSRLAMRSDLGAVLASDQARLPGTYLFRTGGDTTVRGYGYRDIGIDLGGGWVGPGRYMAVGSVEWQRPILQDRFPGLLEHTWFVDVGSVANRVSHLRAHWGVGTGLRLITPVGPMELSIAYGLQSKQLRLHMNVGFVF